MVEDENNRYNVFLACFFFQAEDGIRDLVRSRGLGDVYKRQAFLYIPVSSTSSNQLHIEDSQMQKRNKNRQKLMIINLLSKSLFLGSVSYTHLTLPTSDLV